MDYGKLQQAQQALMPFIKAQTAAKDLKEVLDTVQLGLKELAEAKESLVKVKAEQKAAETARDGAKAVLAKAEADLKVVSDEYKKVQEAIAALAKRA